MNILDWIAFILVIIGGLNWGLAVFDLNVVSMVAGTGLVAKIIYGLVGVAALYFLISMIAKCPRKKKAM